MILSSELKDIFVVALAWIVGGGSAYTGYKLSRRIQKQRLYEYAIVSKHSDTEVKDFPTFNAMVEEYRRDAAESAAKHDAWQTENWNRIPVNDRLRCTARLWKFIPADLINHWVEQKAAGEVIANDDFWFHHNYGMKIRNELRAVLRDDQLPLIQYSDCKFYQNWDDFYRGALNDMIEQAVVAYKVGKAA